MNDNHEQEMKSTEKHAINSRTAFVYCSTYNEIMSLDTFHASSTWLLMAQVQPVAFKNFYYYSRPYHSKQVHNKTTVYMALLRVQKVYTITINQPTMRCCDLVTVHAFLSTEDCSQWCKGTPCIADNIAKFDCITASVKSLTKQ